MTVLSKPDIAAKADTTPSRREREKQQLLHDAAISLSSRGIGYVRPTDLTDLRWGVLTDSVSFRLNGSPRIRFVRQTTAFGGPPAKFTTPILRGFAELDPRALLQRLAQ